MNKLKRSIISGIEKAGYVVLSRTSSTDIQQLLSRLYPKNSGHELIRMGGKADGGYLIPNDLDGISACFSPGVDQTSAFELACSMHGMNVHLADASVQNVGAELKGRKSTSNEYVATLKELGAQISNDGKGRAIDE